MKPKVVKLMAYKRLADLTPEQLERYRDKDRSYREANAEQIRQRKRANYEANAEQLKEQKRAYYAANSEQLRKQKRAYREANPEKIRERERAYRAVNPEKIRERERAYRAAKPEQIKEKNRTYRGANPEKIREGVRAYQQANPEKIRERKRAYREANPEKLRERQRAYQQANPEKIAEWNAYRRAYEMAAFVEKVERKILFGQRNGQCGICGTPVDPARFDIDHIIPYEKGGLNSYENTALAHPVCNGRKNTHIISAVQWPPVKMSRAAYLSPNGADKFLSSLRRNRAYARIIKQDANIEEAA